MEVMDLVLVLGVALVVVWILSRMIRIVPEQEAHVIEQLGKYYKTLRPGLHLVIPFIQRLAYKHTLKEQVIDVQPQVCVTSDNVQVSVDGILYLRVVDAEKASYGIDNYAYATAQLAQTTMRSEIGKIDLDRSFSERDTINDAIVRSVDQASDPWGIKVTRYEIRDISPPDTILAAMESQMRAEREKRAEILKSEGEKTARINHSKGEREEAINLSKGERQRRINDSEGRAQAIELVAAATAQGIKEVATAVRLPKGRQAVALRLADQYLMQLGKLFAGADASVMPVDLANLSGLAETLGAALRPGDGGSPPQAVPAGPAARPVRPNLPRAGAEGGTL